MTVTREAIVGPGFAVCAVEKFVVLVWKDAPCADGVVALKSVFERARAIRRRGQLGFLTLIETNAATGIEAPVRDYLAQVIKENEPAIKAAVIVYEGAGFRATIVRSVITAITMINRTAYWNAVLADRGVAVELLLRQMAGETSADNGLLLSALNELSQHIQQASMRPVHTAG